MPFPRGRHPGSSIFQSAPQGRAFQLDSLISAGHHLWRDKSAPVPETLAQALLLSPLSNPPTPASVPLVKLRRLPEDFQVTEQNRLPIGSDGPYAAYRLTKTSWTTLDALSRCSRTLNLPRRNFQHGGLKDRHAVTSQVITIRNGPRRDHVEDPISLTYLGQSLRPVQADDVVGNTFRIVARSLSEEERAASEQALPSVQQAGIPNYFDDQRFGSYFPGHGFIAEYWIREDYETALQLCFAEPERHDSPAEREQKAILREHWDRWPECKAALERSHRRSIITFLADRPGDFKGAWARVNADLRGLYLSALQSHLWNQVTSDLLELEVPSKQRTAVQLRPGPVWFPNQLSAPQSQRYRDLLLPLPSSRLKALTPEIQERINESLARCGWSLPQLKVKFPRDRFFSRSSRKVLVGVDDLAWEFADDELSPGNSKVTLTLTLPRGAYATMLIKRLFQTLSEEDLTNDADVD